MRYFNKVMFFIWLFLFISTADAKVLRIGSGGVPLNNIFLNIQEPFTESTGIKIEIKKTEPHTALRGLDNNEFDAVAVGLSFKDWMIQAKKSGFGDIDEKKYFQKVISKDTLIFITSLDVKVKKLKFEQLRDIFNGKILNWKAVGGANLPITFISGKDTPGMEGRVKKYILSEGPIKIKQMKTVTLDKIVESVITTPGAIAFGPKAYGKNEKVQEVEIDLDLSTSVTVLTKGEPKAEVKKLLDFIAGEGSKYIVK